MPTMAYCLHSVIFPPGGLLVLDIFEYEMFQFSLVIMYFRLLHLVLYLITDIV